MYCTCGHEHRCHFWYWNPDVEDPIGRLCRHKTDVFGQVKTTTYVEDSDSDDDYITYSSSNTTHGSNTSYTTCYSGQNQFAVPTVTHTTQTTWSTVKMNIGSSGGSIQHGSNWGKVGETSCNCIACQCSYCTSDKAQSDYFEGLNKKFKRQAMERQKELHDQELKKKLEQERQIKIKEENKKWIDANFTGRVKMRGVFKAVISILKELFICQTKRIKCD